MPLIKLFKKYKHSLAQSRKLAKSKKIADQIKDLLIRKRKKIAPDLFEQFKSELISLQETINQKESLKAYQLSKTLLQKSKRQIKKNIFDFFNEWVVGLGLTLLVVALINQMWFQHYQIPSGSMRPTLLEKDRLIATKTCFGINFPFKEDHLYFNSDNLKRGNVAIFTVDNLPAEENKARYLFIFPTKKQMVKRLIGKPGDTLYFYGGKIYGLDGDDNPITDFQEDESFRKLEHIPFISFEGKVVSESPKNSQPLHTPVYLYQMGQAVAKLYTNSQGALVGKFFNGRQWVDESPKLEYKDLWGIKNYGMVRLVDRKQASEQRFDLTNFNQDYFLEILHSPHTSYPRPHLTHDLQGRLRPAITPEKTLIPLSDAHLKKIKGALYTSRFVIQNGYAGNYAMQHKFKPHSYSPKFEGIANGIYEFIDGVAYQISATGSQKKLDENHPLNSTDPKMIQRLFNLGIEMFTLYENPSQYADFIPSRYVYFRDGNLHLLNQVIYSAHDPILKAFVKDEAGKKNGFIDHGSPLVDGKLDKKLIINYGLHIPKGQYLFLGDNHAASRDCRDFGFIPEKNIQGSPAFIISPSNRFGHLKLNSIQWFNLPSITIWAIVIFAEVGISLIYQRSRRKKVL